MTLRAKAKVGPQTKRITESTWCAPGLGNRHKRKVFLLNTRSGLINQGSSLQKV